MNVKHYKLFHYALIILLMIAPLRSIAATPCDMAGMNASSGSADVSAEGFTTVTMAHDMSAMLTNDSSPAEMMSEYNCCDDISINCSAACDMGLSVSLILHDSSYLPVYKKSFRVSPISSKVLFRELTPPSRPPASFHS